MNVSLYHLFLTCVVCNLCTVIADGSFVKFRLTKNSRSVSSCVLRTHSLHSTYEVEIHENNHCPWYGLFTRPHCKLLRNPPNLAPIPHTKRRSNITRFPRSIRSERVALPSYIHLHRERRLNEYRSIWIPHLRNTLKADEDTILIGHSSGASAAMRFAELYPIKGMVLISTALTDMGDEQEVSTPDSPARLL